MTTPVTITTEALRDGNEMRPLVGREDEGPLRLSFKHVGHVSISGAAGWGKTTVGKAVATQLLADGARLVILDPKKIGWMPAFGGVGENVAIRTTTEGQIEAVDAVCAEVDRRLAVLSAAEVGLQGKAPEWFFEPMFLLVEEADALAAQVRANHRRSIGRGFSATNRAHRPRRQELGHESAAGTTMAYFWQTQEILRKGRAVGVHVITLANHPSGVFFNVETRAEYGVRLLLGSCTNANWIMTFPGEPRLMSGRRGPGPDGPVIRGHGVCGGSGKRPREMQAVAVTDQVARAGAEMGAERRVKANEDRARRLAQIAGESAVRPFTLPERGGRFEVR